MAWLSGYSKRRKLALDSSVIDSDLTHFPVPIPLGTSVGITDTDVSSIFDEVGSDYLKIAVTSSDGETQLYVEVEQWDAATEKALLWVSKSGWEIASASDPEIYMYYDSTASDNTAYVGTPGNRTEVWSSDFVAVYTMAQDPSGGAGCIIDSSGNGNHGTPSGFASSDLVNGLIGKAISIESGKYIEIPDAPNLRLNNFTIIQTLKTSQQVTKSDYWELPRLFWKDISGLNTADYNVMNDNGKIRFHTGIQDQHLFSNTSISDGQFHSTVCTRKQSTGHKQIFIDGVLDNSADHTTGDLSNTASIKIGQKDADFDLERLIFSSGVWTSAWIKADYHAQTDNLITWGAEETPGIDITAAPIQSTTQITANVTSRIEIVAAPIQSNTQITARVRMFWPHKLNGLASGNIASFYRQAVNIEDVDKINDV